MGRAHGLYEGLHTRTRPSERAGNVGKRSRGMGFGASVKYGLSRAAAALVRCKGERVYSPISRGEEICEEDLVGLPLRGRISTSPPTSPFPHP